MPFEKTKETIKTAKELFPKVGKKKRSKASKRVSEGNKSESENSMESAHIDAINDIESQHAEENACNLSLDERIEKKLHNVSLDDIIIEEEEDMEDMDDISLEDESTACSSLEVYSDFEKEARAFEDEVAQKKKERRKKLKHKASFVAASVLAVKILIVMIILLFVFVRNDILSRHNQDTQLPLEAKSQGSSSISQTQDIMYQVTIESRGNMVDEYYDENESSTSEHISRSFNMRDGEEVSDRTFAVHLDLDETDGENEEATVKLISKHSCCRHQLMFNGIDIIDESYSNWSRVQTCRCKDARFTYQVRAMVTRVGEADSAVGDD